MPRPVYPRNVDICTDRVMCVCSIMKLLGHMNRCKYRKNINDKNIEDGMEVWLCFILRIICRFGFLFQWRCITTGCFTRISTFNMEPSAARAVYVSQGLFNPQIMCNSYMAPPVDLYNSAHFLSERNMLWPRTLWRGGFGANEIRRPITFESIYERMRVREELLRSDNAAFCRRSPRLEQMTLQYERNSDRADDRDDHVYHKDSSTKSPVTHFGISHENEALSPLSRPHSPESSSPLRVSSPINEDDIEVTSEPYLKFGVRAILSKTEVKSTSCDHRGRCWSF